METKLHILLIALKVLILKTFIVIMKKQELHLIQDLQYMYHPPTKKKIHEKKPLNIFQFFSWAEKY